MKKYSAEDIKAIEWEPHVRKRPEMYFGEAEVTPQEISDSIRYSAELLGARETRLIEIEGWYYFCSDIDWIFLSEFPISSVEQVFQGPCPFPEAGSPNSFRCEALCLPFSSDAFTVTEAEVTNLKGELPSRFELEQHTKKLGSWGRIVGFKFSKNA